MTKTQPTFITGTAIALVSKYRTFDVSNPSATPASEFTFVPEGTDTDSWLADGYISVGTAELTVKVSTREDITRNAVAGLRKQQQAVRAEAEQSAQRIERQIQQLLAITNEAA